VIKKTVFITVLLLALLPGAAQAAKCLGQPASVIARSGSVTVPRSQAVILTGARVNVLASGDTRICSTDGDINLRFGKGMINRAALGSGNDTVTVTEPARANYISLGGGNNRARIADMSRTHSITAGNGNDYIKVTTKATNVLVNSGGGADRVLIAGRANSQRVVTGAGNDQITVTANGSALRRELLTGTGNDRVEIGAMGNTTTYLSNRKQAKSASDIDFYAGGDSIDTVYDYYGGTAERPNYIDGKDGLDKLYSLGSAHSEIYGGGGSDLLFSASSGVSGDRIFGDRGNDKIRADRGKNQKGAYIDPGDGDDWIYGTDGDDFIVTVTGIKKIYANAGDDTIIRSRGGLFRINGGGGSDLVSYASHTSPGYRGRSGVYANLQTGEAFSGRGRDYIDSIERLRGSPFDDILIAQPQQNNVLEGGLGDDELTGYSSDRVDGGPGENICTGGEQSLCNEDSPGSTNQDRALIDIGSDGVLALIGSKFADDFVVGYQDGSYQVSSNRPAIPSEGCRAFNNDGPGLYRYFCPVRRDMLSTATVTTAAGADTLKISSSVPPSTNIVVSGGSGSDRFTGSSSREIVYLFERVNSGAGNDHLYINPGAILNAGPGSDLVQVPNPCQGGFIDTGSGSDNIVFAGAEHGVDANLTTRVLRWNKRPCAKPTRISPNTEALEGSRFADVLTVSRRGSSALLGREGNDTFYARNGRKDGVTTGGGGKGNRVFADKIDKVTWGWGFAAF